MCKAHYRKHINIRKFSSASDWLVTGDWGG